MHAHVRDNMYVWFATYYTCSAKAHGKEMTNKRWKKEDNNGTMACLQNMGQNKYKFHFK
jgi:hypothetical protein